MAETELIDETGRVVFRGTQSPGGGSMPGAITVRTFPVAFNSAGLYTGAGFPLFTTEAGEQILDAWVFTGTPWDAGTTPLIDFGSAAELANGEGWYVAPSLSPYGLKDTGGSVFTDSAVVEENPLAAQAIAASASAVPRIYAAATGIVAVAWDDNSVSESAPEPFGATAGELVVCVKSVNAVRR